MDTLMQDLRYSLRILLKNPAFILIAVLTLALRIGANTALFSLVNAELLRPMPYQRPEQLLALKGGQSWPDLYDIQQQAHSLEKVGAYAPWQFDLVGSGEPKLVDAALVSLDLFPVLGVNAHSGRTFGSADDLIGGAHVEIGRAHV